MPNDDNYILPLEILRKMNDAKSRRSLDLDDVIAERAAIVRQSWADQRINRQMPHKMQHEPDKATREAMRVFVSRAEECFDLNQRTGGRGEGLPKAE